MSDTFDLAFGATFASSQVDADAAKTFSPTRDLMNISAARIRRSSIAWKVPTRTNRFPFGGAMLARA